LAREARYTNGVPMKTLSASGNMMEDLLNLTMAHFHDVDCMVKHIDGALADSKTKRAPVLIRGAAGFNKQRMYAIMPTRAQKRKGVRVSYHPSKNPSTIKWPCNTHSNYIPVPQA
jgi:hypothetical protein